MAKPDRLPPNTLPAQPWTILENGDAGIEDVFMEHNEISVTERNTASDSLRLREVDDHHVTERNSFGLNVDESVKRDPEKVGFFDLPPELRLPVYAMVCEHLTSLYDDRPNTNEDAAGRLLISTALWQRNQRFACLYRDAQFLKLQCVSRKFRAEFLATWAENTVQHCKVPISFWRKCKAKELPITNAQLAYRVWEAIRAHLQDLQARLHVAPNVKHIKLYITVTAASPATPCSLLSQFSGRQVARHMERLDHSLAHPELIIETEIVCTHSLDGVPLGPLNPTLYRRARLSISMRQSSALREEHRLIAHEWECNEETPLQLRNLYKDDNRRPLQVSWLDWHGE